MAIGLPVRSERGTGEELGVGAGALGEAAAGDSGAGATDSVGSGTADGVWLHPARAMGRSAAAKAQRRPEVGDTD